MNWQLLRRLESNLAIQHFGCQFQVNPLYAAKFRLAFTCHGGTMQPLCPISRPV